MASCGDCLIWIGSSYPTITDFVTEARKFGCSRQVPSWPWWLRRGSRIFLAHRGAFKELDKGVVFGYFTLHGVDVILTPEDYDRYHRCRTDEDKIRFWEERRPRGLPVRPKLPPPPAKPDDDLLEFIVDFVLGCDAERPDGPGRGISTENTALSRARDCGSDGLRLGPERSTDGHPTLYLVDALEREIANEFCEAVKELIMEMMKKKKTRRAAIAELRRQAKKHVKSKRQEGHPKFTQVVEHVNDRRKSQADESPLVLFPEPFPLFQRAPLASFRGVLRIDGDDLLNRVAVIPRGQQGKVLIPYCDESKSGKPRSLLVNSMARDFGLSRNHAIDIARAISGAVTKLGTLKVGTAGTLAYDANHRPRVTFTP